MKKSQLAVQLYTLRDFIKSPFDIAATFRKVREIGYEAIQVSGMGPIAEEELVKIANDNGLVICATHENARTICEDTDKVIERLKKLNCRYKARNDNDVSCNTNLLGNKFSQKRNKQIGANEYGGCRQAHTNAIGDRGGGCQHGTHTEKLYKNGVACQYSFFEYRTK